MRVGNSLATNIGPYYS